MGITLEINHYYHYIPMLVYNNSLVITHFRISCRTPHFLFVIICNKLAVLATTLCWSEMKPISQLPTSEDKLF